MKKLVEAADKMHSVLLGRVTFLIAQDPEKGSRWGKELVKLAKIVEAYEKLRWPIHSSTSGSRKKKGSKILAYYRS